MQFLWQCSLFLLEVNNRYIHLLHYKMLTLLEYAVSGAKSEILNSWSDVPLVIYSEVLVSGGCVSAVFEAWLSLAWFCWPAAFIAILQKHCTVTLVSGISIC